ncbi:MAG TPA: CBS domain-containing protein [Candidatus Nanoarchaeia archaeon]|nr:CBS domain-containing protein [Candidatus Nanoarchaeia archaeon]
MELHDIKQLRRKFELTQTGLAKLAGVSQSLIAKIESGKIDPTYSNAKKIFESLSSIQNRKELKAQDVMNRKVVAIDPESPIKAATNKMKRYGISQLVVTEHEKPVGIISESIILDSLLTGKGKTVREVMSDCPPLVPASAGVSAFSHLLRYYPLIIVMEKGRVQGVITKADLITKVHV